jgi:hypothetical protein
VILTMRANKALQPTPLCGDKIVGILEISSNLIVMST